jgi:hypothetical protein
MNSLAFYSSGTNGMSRHFSGRNTNTRSPAIYVAKSPAFRGAFYAVLNRWLSETQFTSDPEKKTSHPSFLALVEHADEVLDLIQMDLSRKPSTLVWVLEDHFQVQPYAPDDVGDITKQTNRWLNYLSQNG